MDRRNFIALAGTGMLMASLAGCAKAGKIQTNETIDGLSLFQKAKTTFPKCHVVISDKSYKPVKTDWLVQKFYPEFHSELFDKGITKWDSKFDCDKYAKYFSALLQITYFIENFHSWEKSESLAVGEIYYKVGGLADKGHAINCVYSDEKFLFLEPQTGKFVTLSPVELSSAFLVKM